MYRRFDTDTVGVRVVFCVILPYFVTSEITYAFLIGMWIELAEAQLNYAFGQTDTLLEALDVPPTSNSADKDKTQAKVCAV